MRRTLPLAPAMALGVGFYDDMTEHHFQAIQMARTYMRRGDDPVLRSMAGEIDFDQAGEIRLMQDAMIDWGEVGTPGVAMEWMGEGVAPTDMPGLATPQELAALDAATGQDLDDLFTQLMIEHHAGGAAMAEAAADDARLGEVRDLAAAMAFNQRREIDEMNHRRLDIDLPIVEPEAHTTHP